MYLEFLPLVHVIFHLFENKICLTLWRSTVESHATHLPKRSQSRSIPRSQSTCEFSESARFDLPRLLPAACYKELVGYNRTHFKGLPAPDEPSSALYGNSKNLASASFVSVPMDTGRIAEMGKIVQYRHQDMPGSFQPGILPLTQKELILKIVWSSCRGI